MPAEAKVGQVFPVVGVFNLNQNVCCVGQRVIWHPVYSVITGILIEFLGVMYLDAGKYAQVTNNPENDGCINAVLLV